MAGRKGHFMLVNLSHKVAETITTGIQKPTYLNYAADTSEIWIIGADKKWVRINPKSLSLLDANSSVWETSISDQWQLKSPAYGVFDLYQKQKKTPEASLAGSIILPGNNTLIHEDGSIITTGSGNKLTAWNIKTGSYSIKTGLKSPPGMFALACQKKCILMAENQNSTQTFFWRIGQKSDEAIPIQGRFFFPTTSQGEIRLASDGNGEKMLMVKNKTLSVVQLSEQGVLGTIASTPFNPSWAFLSEDGATVIASEEGELLVANANTLQALETLADFDSDQSRAAVAPKANYALLGKSNGQHTIVDFANQTTVLELDVGNLELLVEFGNTGEWLAVQSQTGDLQVYESHSGKEVVFSKNKPSKIQYSLFSKDDKYLIVEDVDSQWSVWSLQKSGT